MKVLIKQRHGLGDAVQLTVVLKHLRRYRPDWLIDVELGKGKNVTDGLCNQTWETRENPAKGDYDRVFDLAWMEPDAAYDDVPSTKISRCLHQVFDLQPISELYTYEITKSDAAIRLARDYLRNIPKRKGYVFIHYQGNSSCVKKNTSHEDIRSICEYLLENQFTPIILDWDRRSPLIDQRTIFCPDKEDPIWKNTGMGDAPVIAALIEEGKLFIGVDSGPLHIAGATKTPAVGLWLGNHPINFFDLSSNVLHLIPQDARRNIRGKDKDKAQNYFEKHYQFKYYNDLRLKTLTEIASILEGPQPNLNPMPHAQQLHSKAYGEAYYLEHKSAGLDYAVYGDWQKNYARWVTDSLGWKNKKILDVGCACGAVTKGLLDSGCLVSGCDLNEFCIKLGRKAWPELPLFVCDAMNIHPCDDRSFDGIHSMQTLEHIRPEYVPFALGEFNRICTNDGLLLTIHDTAELFARQNRDGKKEDPTHVCIRPRRWWHSILEMTGWADCSAEYIDKLKDHSLSYLQTYNWDVFCYKKIRHISQ